MIRPLFAALLSMSLCLASQAAPETNANRLVYLDENDPFYPGLAFPKLTTPQWIGEPGVEAVVILAIDDMTDPQRYETFLRPVLNRLKQIDGRAPVSIFCKQLDPQTPQLQAWLKEGLSFEAHTLSHPCPLLADSNFVAAATNYHDCIDLLDRIPGNHAVAFRMPCCDSMNSPSPRFFAEMFSRTSSAGQFLTMDSSVMNLTTPRDPSLPRDLVRGANGEERFRKYWPSETNAVAKVSLKWFATTIEDYPYPYIIGKQCWEFPPMVPSDWEASNTHGATNAATVRDWEAALDAAVLKQGTFTFIFHPYGWIRPEQLVEFIDYAEAKHGKKVKFLNFREAGERLDRNLLAGEPLRAPNGQDNGARLLDINNDGYLDVVIGNERVRKTRLWRPGKNEWEESDFPAVLASAGADGNRRDAGVKFGILSGDGNASALVRNEKAAGAWHFDGQQWIADASLLAGLEIDGQPVFTSRSGQDQGVRLRDVERAGRCALLVSNPKQNALFSKPVEAKSWEAAPFALPAGTPLVDDQGGDNGLRFTDINRDGYDDLVFSNEQEFGLYMFIATPKQWLGWGRGWSFKVTSGKRGDPGEIPMIVRGGPIRNNGAWFHQGQMCVQNEDTSSLPDKIDRRPFAQLLSIAEAPPKSPRDSLAAIRVMPGFKVEAVATEPLVVDPVAFDWGPDGKMWVVEMRDYPLGIDGHGKSGGVIKYLEDTDGDGRYDKATVFMEGVNFPNGIKVWRKGVLVSAAPDIFYAEDTDGDGKADLRWTILTGFNQGNQQHRVNGFEYGLDHWVYAANGGSGGTIKSELTGKTANIRGHDLRFNPDTGEFELIEGQTQFGRRRDDWGNWFGNENPTWLWHYYLPEHYLARNPGLAVDTTKRLLANYPNSTRVFPISHPQQRFNWPDAANSLTSANSATPYRDTLFGPEFETSVFISEPAQNVVHREVLEPDGVSFKSHRAPGEEDSEFLASSDNWFRPTMLKTGPDGALYISDMYRLVIEHPEYFPDELKNRPDLRAGEDMGRIYRVYPEGAHLRAIPRLDRLSAKELAHSLESSNGWERDLASRMLIWQGGQTPEADLARIAAQWENPKSRIQALSTLAALGLLTPQIVIHSLSDKHQSVREFALQLSEPFLKNPPSEAFLRDFEQFLAGAVMDPSPRLRFQLAFTVGEWNDPRAGEVLVRLANDGSSGREMRTAALSSASSRLPDMIQVVLSQAETQRSPLPLRDELIRMAVKKDDRKSLAKVLIRLAAPDGKDYAHWQTMALASFLDGLSQRGVALADFRGGADSQMQADLQKLDGLFVHARTLVDSGTPSPSDDQATETVAAIQTLGRGLNEQDRDIKRLGLLLQPQVQGVLQQAALANLKETPGSAAAAAILAGWKSYGPSLRIEALNILLSRAEGSQALMAAVESGAIAPAELGAIHQQRLLKHSDRAIRERAERLFAARNSDRLKIVNDFAIINELRGEASRGAPLYRQNCSPCHKLKGEGSSVGPDLGTVADKPVGTLLVAILDPSQAFETKYTGYTASTRDGRDITGIIASETPNSIALRTAGGKDEVLLRSDIKELTSSRLSLMPEGLEGALKPADMADLIAYIRAK